MADDLTGREIARRLDENAEAVAGLSEQITRLGEKAEQAYLPRETLDLKFLTLEERIDARDAAQKQALASLAARLDVIQNWQQWAVRLIVGAIVTVLLTSVLSLVLRSGVL